MPYLVKWPLVTAKGRAGNIDYYYLGQSPTIIPWLSAEDAERLVELGAVERLDGGDEEEQAEREQAEARSITECAALMDELGLPQDCGAPAAREALRLGGHKIANETIAAAVKVRKSHLSRTG